MGTYLDNGAGEAQDRPMTTTQSPRPDRVRNAPRYVNLAAAHRMGWAHEAHAGCPGLSEGAQR